MAAVDLPSNSFKSREAAKPDKNLTKVVSGPVKKANTTGRKLQGIFAPGDGKEIGRYILDDVLIPSIKRAVDDIISNGIHMLLYGDGGSPKSSNTRAGSIQYSSLYDNVRSSYSSRSASSASSARYEDVVLPSKRDAEEVLSRLDELMDVYGVVSVADLNELVGISGSYTDNNYGWTSLKSADILRVRDGYLLKLPRATVIK